LVRLFIAIDTPPAQAAALLATLPSHPGIRPAPVAQLHLTLCFLGERDADAVPTVERALGGVSMPAFAMAAQGAGRFRGRQGSVLWAGVADPAPLLALHAALRQALRDAGVPLARERFLPHLTLARCRSAVPEPLVRAWLAAQRDACWPPCAVDRFLLYASELQADGAHHHVLHAYPLGGATTAC